VADGREELVLRAVDPLHLPPGELRRLARQLLADELPPALLRRALGREVAGHLREAGDLPLLILERRDDDAGPEPAAILAYAKALVLEAPLAPHLGEDGVGLPRGAILGRVEDGEVLADDLARLVPFVLPRAGVPGGDVPRGVEHEDRVVGDRVDELVEARLGGVELLVGGALRRQVTRHLREAGDLAVLVLERRDDDAGPEARAVLAYAKALVLEAPLAEHRREDRLRPARGALLGRVEDGEVLSDDLLRLVPLDLLRAEVPGGDVPGRVEHEDRVVGDGVDELVEALLRSAERLL
jgi:hypothetical protein